MSKKPKKSFKSKKSKVALRLVEFFVIGLAMGVAEDLIAIKLATDAVITWRVFWVALLVALPFALISEIVVDGPNFRNWLREKLHLL